jgi:hypothetical protein
MTRNKAHSPKLALQPQSVIAQLQTHTTATQGDEPLNMEQGLHELRTTVAKLHADAVKQQNNMETQQAVILKQQSVIFEQQSVLLEQQAIIHKQQADLLTQHDELATLQEKLNARLVE